MNQQLRDSADPAQKCQIEQSSSNSSPPKLKIISKNSKAGRPSKKSKNKNPNEDESQASPLQANQTIASPAFDPFEEIYDNIMAHLIEFFDSTNERKGFVYGKDIRAKLIKADSNPTQWSQQAQWHIDRQREKVEKALNFQCKMLTPDQRNKIEKVLLQTSGIFAQEFTREYYSIVLRVYTALVEGVLVGDENAFEQIADSIYQNHEREFNFFSYEFRAKLNFKDEFVRPDSNKHYRTLINAIKQELQKL